MKDALKIFSSDEQMSVKGARVAAVSAAAIGALAFYLIKRD